MPPELTSTFHGDGDEATIVLDVGKTHTKLTLWDARGKPCARRMRANETMDCAGYIGLDALRIEAWLAATLREFAHLARVRAIVPVGHGAAAAILHRGHLAGIPMSYESLIPPEVVADYRKLRDPFRNTGSPRLPDGLNLGTQLYWLEQLQPGVFGPGTQIVTWAQYWAWVLSGVATTEVTSLGCHSDLWLPHMGQPSQLAILRGWAACLAPRCRADSVLGTLRPEWAARTGLAPDTDVYCGMHDSNAALFGCRGFVEIGSHEATVLSTGTWFVAMRTPGRESIPALDENRDTLLNVDVEGTPIPSARFMGGREIDILTSSSGKAIDAPEMQRKQLEAVSDVLETPRLIRPTLTPGVGPFAGGAGGWDNEPRDVFVRLAATSIYAALVTDAVLDLIGSRERVVVEGRFADATIFVRALASLRTETTVYVSRTSDAVPYGALRLVDPTLAPPVDLVPVEPLAYDLSAYHAAWKNACVEVTG